MQSFGTGMTIVDARLGGGSNLTPTKLSWYMAMGTLRWIFHLERARKFALLNWEGFPFETF